MRGVWSHAAQHEEAALLCDTCATAAFRCAAQIFFLPPLPLMCGPTFAADYVRISGDKRSRRGFSALQILGAAAAPPRMLLYLQASCTMQSEFPTPHTATPPQHHPHHCSLVCCCCSPSVRDERPQQRQIL